MSRDDESGWLGRRYVAIQDVLAEVDRAAAKFNSFNSAHEGYAVMAEEVDGLWDEVKTNPHKTPDAIKDDPNRNVRVHKARMRAEAVQVAAMAIRFITDCT